VTIDDFGKLDLRVADRHRRREPVEGSDKLLKLTLEPGASERRTVFSGIRKSYAAEAASSGRQIVMIANLAPRKMRFGTSEGMVLCASGDDDRVFLLGRRRSRRRHEDFLIDRGRRRHAR
jgi:methionyl-tRNA synthetase